MERQFYYGGFPPCLHKSAWVCKPTAWVRDRSRFKKQVAAILPAGLRHPKAGRELKQVGLTVVAALRETRRSTEAQSGLQRKW